MVSLSNSNGSLFDNFLNIESNGFVESANGQINNNRNNEAILLSFAEIFSVLEIVFGDVEFVIGCW